MTKEFRETIARHAERAGYKCIDSETHIVVLDRGITILSGLSIGEIIDLRCRYGSLGMVNVPSETAIAFAKAWPDDKETKREKEIKRLLETISGLHKQLRKQESRCLELLREVAHVKAKNDRLAAENLALRRHLSNGAILHADDDYKEILIEWSLQSRLLSVADRIMSALLRL